MNESLLMRYFCSKITNFVIITVIQTEFIGTILKNQIFKLMISVQRVAFLCVNPYLNTKLQSVI